MAPTLMPAQGTTKTAIAPRLTAEEYLLLDRGAAEKSEFFDGQMYPMPGGSFNHSTLAGELIGILRTQRPQQCRLLTSDMRIYIPATSAYAYPDAGMVCGEPLFHNGQQDVLLNPVLLVEVLSASSEDYDPGRKFAMYRTIESLREYLVIHQNRRSIEYSSRQADGSWLLRDYAGIDATIHVESLSLKIPLGELYSVALDLS